MLSARLSLLFESALLEGRKTSSMPRRGRRVFREAAALGILQVHLSGGEPGSRRDLVEIVPLRRAAGLYRNLITSGVGSAPRRGCRLADGGLDHVQMSIQDSEPARPIASRAMGRHRAQARAGAGNRTA